MGSFFFWGGGGGGEEWHKRKNLQIADVQRLASLPVGVSETQPSKTKTSEPKKLRFALLRNLRPRKTQTPSYHKPQTPKNSDPLYHKNSYPKKLGHLCIMKPHTRQKLRCFCITKILYHENSDPSYCENSDPLIS